jgi:hypothetical protein
MVSKQRTTCRFSTLFLPIRIPQSEIRNRWQHFFGTGFAGLGRMGVMGRMMDGEPRGLIYEKSMTQDTSARAWKRQQVRILRF